MKLKGKVVGVVEDGEGMASIRVQFGAAECFFRALGVRVPLAEAEHWPLGMPVTVTVEKGEPNEDS